MSYKNLLLPIIILFSGCETLIQEEKNSNKGNYSTETRLEIKANLDDQEAYTNKMSDFNPETIKTIDDRMAEITDRIPGFAGYYLEPRDPDLFNIEITDIETALRITKNMLPIVRLTNPERVTAATHTELRQALSEAYDMERTMSRHSEFIIRPAKYDFRQLQDWRLSIKDYEGMNSVRIDEKGNRIEVGVSKKVYVENVRSKLINSGIPQDAFSVIVKRTVRLDSNSVEDTYRPVIGGLEVNRNFIYNCTLGFTALISGNPYFVTNSHCSSVPFSTDSGPMYQVYPSQIGYEYYDPPLFNCPYGNKCRITDASLYRLNSGVQYNNHIAFPDTEGSLIFDETKNVAAIKQPPEFSPIIKVGRTTGLQVGFIWDSCESSKGTDGVWRMCSIESTLNSDDGDSGAPVFWVTGGDVDSPDVELYGIHWGSNSSRSFASPIALILSELGSMTITF